MIKANVFDIKVAHRSETYLASHKYRLTCQNLLIFYDLGPVV